MIAISLQSQANHMWKPHLKPNLILIQKDADNVDDAEGSTNCWCPFKCGPSVNIVLNTDFGSSDHTDELCIQTKQSIKIDTGIETGLHCVCVL